MLIFSYFFYFYLLTWYLGNRVAALEQIVSPYHDQPAEIMECMKEAFEQLADANAQLEKVYLWRIVHATPQCRPSCGTASYEGRCCRQRNKHRYFFKTHSYTILINSRVSCSVV